MGIRVAVLEGEDHTLQPPGLLPSALQELSEAAPELLIPSVCVLALPTTGDCSGSNSFPHLWKGTHFAV